MTSVEAGRSLYVANCAACHGVDARGGGPQAGTTAVRPPSLVSGHLGSHPDGDIYYWITNGLPGGMPVWGTKLTDTERWELVNYLRSINGAQPSAGSAGGEVRRDRRTRGSSSWGCRSASASSGARAHDPGPSGLPAGRIVARRPRR